MCNAYGHPVGCTCGFGGATNHAPPSSSLEDPVMGTVVAALWNPINFLLHCEIKCENGDLVIVERTDAAPADNLEGSPAMVYPKSRMIRVASLYAVSVERMDIVRGGVREQSTILEAKVVVVDDSSVLTHAGSAANAGSDATNQ